MLTFIMVIHFPLTNEIYQKQYIVFLLCCTGEASFQTPQFQFLTPALPNYTGIISLKGALILSLCQFLYYSKKLTLPQTFCVQVKGVC